MCQYRPSDPASRRAWSAWPSVVGEPRQCGPHVGVFLVQGLGPLRLRGAAQAGLGLLGEGEVELRVRGGQRVSFPGAVELVGGVLAQRLEHPVAGVARGALRDHERLPDQPVEQVQHGRGRQIGTGDDVLGGVEGPAAAEHGEPAEQQPLRRGEQVVAPVDGSAQGLLAGVGGAAAGGQKGEPVLDAVGELGRAEAGEPGRGQLQGKRDAVQALADDADGGQRLRIEDEIGGGGEGTVEEQLGGGEGRDAAGGCAGCRYR